MRTPVTVGILAATALFAHRASAATSLVVPPGGGLGALAVSVDAASKTVRYASCKAEPCATADGGTSLAIPTEVALDASRASVVLVQLSGGRSLAHVRVALEPTEPNGLAWEALLIAGAPPLFAGLTGFRRGEPGERSGTAIQLLKGEHAATVVIGEIREDLRVCGEDATLLDPRGLDPATLLFRGATLQRLPRERREAAVAITAVARHASAEPTLAPLLAATEASSAIGTAAALTDGDPKTSWSEARPGQGQGEFVVLRAPFDVPLVRFAVTVAPASTKAKPEGAAPETFYLASNTTAYEVTLPEDAWAHPGEAYDVTLPEPLRTSCVALVLSDAFAHGKRHPEVTVSKLAAYSSFDRGGATLAEVAAALSGPNGAAAAAVLEQAGASGVAAAAAVYPTLSPAGRALALDVARSAPCATSASILIPALGDSDDVVRKKARAKLEQGACGREALPALIAALASPGTRVSVAPLVALLGHEKVLPTLVEALGRGTADDRSILRSAVASSARRASAEEITTALDTSSKRSLEVGLDALRALRARLVDAPRAADATAASLLAQKPAPGARYLLVDVLAPLAATGDAAAQAMLGELTHDAAVEVRARATEYLDRTPTPDKVIDSALHDDAPRVREAALRAVAVGRRPVASAALARLLSDDPWSFVRVAAAVALARLPANAEGDRALADAMDQLSPRVREQAALGLGGHAAVAYRSVVRSHLTDAKEDVAVRIATIRAAGLLCDAKSIEDLAKLAVNGGSSPDSREVTLGLAATAALGAIHPKELPQLFVPLQAKNVRPDARAAGAEALARAPEASCRLP